MTTPPLGVSGLQFPDGARDVAAGPRQSSSYCQKQQEAWPAFPLRLGPRRTILSTTEIDKVFKEMVSCAVEAYLTEPCFGFVHDLSILVHISQPLPDGVEVG